MLSLGLAGRRRELVRAVSEASLAIPVFLHLYLAASGVATDVITLWKLAVDRLALCLT